MRIRTVAASLFLATSLTSAAFAQEDVARTYTKAELQKIILETLMQHPEAIISSVEGMQKKQSADSKEKATQNILASKDELFSDKMSPVAGNKKGDVTVVEFFDYNCGYCKRSFEEVLKLTQADKNVKLIFKEYPVLAPSSMTAARASIAFYMLKPERYFDFQAALFRLGGRFDDKTLAGVAEGMGADPKKFEEKLKDPAIDKHLEDNQRLAAKLGARGVPMFIIGEELFPGAISFEQLKSEVEAAREAQKKKP